MDLAGAEFYIGRLRKEGRHSTAHVYKNAPSFSKFCGTSNVSFRLVTRERLRRYGQYLYECGLRPNTISTYMRMLRSVYNRGVEGQCAIRAATVSMFIQVWMSARKGPAWTNISFCMKIQNRSLPYELLLRSDVSVLWNVICRFSPFEKSALNQNVLRYNRIKTKTPMSVEVLNTAKEMINQLQ